MDIFKLIGVGILAAAAILTVRETRPDIALMLTIASGIVILLMIFDGLTEVITTFNGIANRTGIDDGLFGGMLKIIGVGYITEFAADICSDSGLKSLSDKIVFGGKVIIMLLAMPIVTSIIDLIAELLG